MTHTYIHTHTFTVNSLQTFAQLLLTIEDYRHSMVSYTHPLSTGLMPCTLLYRGFRKGMWCACVLLVVIRREGDQKERGRGCVLSMVMKCCD